MSKVALNEPAPKFELSDYLGKSMTLAEFHGKKNIVLIFNRGFT